MCLCVGVGVWFCVRVWVCLVGGNTAHMQMKCETDKFSIKLLLVTQEPSQVAMEIAGQRGFSTRQHRFIRSFNYEIKFLKQQAQKSNAKRKLNVSRVAQHSSTVFVFFFVRLRNWIDA